MNTLQYAAYARLYNFSHIFGTSTINNNNNNYNPVCNDETIKKINLLWEMIETIKSFDGLTRRSYIIPYGMISHKTQKEWPMSKLKLYENQGLILEMMDDGKIKASIALSRHDVLRGFYDKPGCFCKHSSQPIPHPIDIQITDNCGPWIYKSSERVYLSTKIRREMLENHFKNILLPNLHLSTPEEKKKFFIGMFLFYGGNKDFVDELRVVSFD